MYKKLIAIVLFSISAIASAANIELEDNEANCRKVQSHAANDKIAVATKFQVPVSSVRFLGAKRDVNQYGTRSCLLIFDTAKGPKTCTPILLLSDDNGKTAFGAVNPYGGNPICW